MGALRAKGQPGYQTVTATFLLHFRRPFSRKHAALSLLTLASDARVANRAQYDNSNPGVKYTNVLF
jgi:hypothetical protein